MADTFKVRDADWQALLDQAATGVASHLEGSAGLKVAVGDLGIVSVTGDDAEVFLHAQFSADCRALTEGDSVLTAWCTPKGRVLYLLRVLRGRSGFVLLLPAAQVQPLCKRLGMFVLRAAVTIDDLSDGQGVIRLLGASLPAPLDDVLLARDGDNAWLVGPHARLVALWSALDATPASADVFKLEDIRGGIPSLSAELGDQFLPQELNLDLNGGVSFNKGCYPGQEIIARVKFRGSVKRRLARLSGDLEALPASGTRLHDNNNNPVGTLLAGAHNSEGKAELLAVIDQGNTRVGLDGRELLVQRLAVHGDLDR